MKIINLTNIVLVTWLSRGRIMASSVLKEFPNMLYWSWIGGGGRGALPRLINSSVYWLIYCIGGKGSELTWTGSEFVAILTIGFVNQSQFIIMYNFLILCRKGCDYSRDFRCDSKVFQNINKRLPTLTITSKVEWRTNITCTGPHLTCFNEEISKIFFILTPFLLNETYIYVLTEQLFKNLIIICIIVEILIIIQRFIGMFRSFNIFLHKYLTKF